MRALRYYKGNNTVLAFKIAMLALVVGGAVFVWNARKTADRHAAELGRLSAQRVELSKKHEGLLARKRFYNESMRELDSLKILIPTDLMGVYSEIQSVVGRNGVDIMSTAQSSSEENGVTVERLKLVLRGDYYGIIGSLSDWRRLPFVLWVSSATFRNTTPPDRKILAADVEVRIASKLTVAPPADDNEEE